LEAASPANSATIGTVSFVGDAPAFLVEEASAPFEADGSLLEDLSGDAEAPLLLYSTTETY